ncbi:hypothetical protein OAI23_01590 [Alphaproteobacteria bacterium]|nr:hypothetical protein [Alphaproteobacteria bacterium]MDC1120829.1 hypothetical protein [Alphaproteobacteria bacterium]
MSDEKIRHWAKSVDGSLTASLILGRASARAIAKVHLIELFKLVGGDQDAGLAEVATVRSFASRRLLMECFRLTFSLIDTDPKYHILLEKVDLYDQATARGYDQALSALLRECGGEKDTLAAKVMHYPITKRRVLLERLEHPDFRKSRRIRLNQNVFSSLSKSQSEYSPLSWWQWAIVIVAITSFVALYQSN